MQRLGYIFRIALLVDVSLTVAFGFSALPSFMGGTFTPRGDTMFSHRVSLVLPSTPGNIAEKSEAQPDSKASLYRTLYDLPPLRRNGTIALDSLHEMYYEEYGIGNSSGGKIALSLHGGPGASSFPNHARFFDPEKYSSIFLFDQRGCGKSQPRGEIRNNTLHHLVMDIEKLRSHLDVEVWDTVLGGSWGSTLALAYAQAFPTRVAGLVLRGICLFRSKEIDWLFGNDANNSSDFISASNDTEKLWIKFDKAINSTGKIDDKSPRSVLHNYYNCLLGDDPILRLHAARQWMGWEFGVSSVTSSARKIKAPAAGNSHSLVWLPERGWSLFDQSKKSNLIDQDEANQYLSSLKRWTHKSEFDSTQKDLPREIELKGKEAIPEEYRAKNKNVTEEEAKSFVPSQAMLTCYYSVNDQYMMQYFQLLSKENIDKIRHIPCIGIQGGQDPICPPDTAIDLHSHWPEMELRVVLTGKHSMYDTPITSELISATDRLG